VIYFIGCAAVVTYIFTLIFAGLKKNVILFYFTNAVALAASILSGFITWAAWDGRNSSENWAIIGFIFFSVPFILLTLLYFIIQLIIIRNWEKRHKYRLRIFSACLIVFLLLQLVMEFSSG